jgi:hypothetical protein
MSSYAYAANKPFRALRAASYLLAIATLAACSNNANEANLPALSASGSAGVGLPNAGGVAGGSAAAGSMSAPSTAGTGSSLGSAGSPSASSPGVGAAGNTSAAASGTAGTGSAGMAATAGSSAGTGAAGTAANSGGASGGDAAGQGGALAIPHEDLGKGDGSDVVLLGDSWMSNTLQIEGTGGGIAASLIALTKQPYRNYAVQGVMLLMADSFGPAIPSQWDQAKAVNPKIKTVVMTAGGNDIIQNTTLEAACKDGTDACKQVLMQISDTLNMLWTKMANDGVQDIVYIEYADDVGTLNDSLRGDKGRKPPEICTTGKVRCHSVNTTAAVMHQIAADNIHPLQAANDRVAKVVADLMVQEGIRR